MKGLASAAAYSDGTWLYCSGTPISPAVVLAAAPCDKDGERARVTFDSAYEAGDTVNGGTCYGESAGPNFLGTYRLDTGSARLSARLRPPAVSAGREQRR